MQTQKYGEWRLQTQFGCLAMAGSGEDDDMWSLQDRLNDPAWHARVNSKVFQLRSISDEAAFRAALLDLLGEFALEHYILVSVDEGDRGAEIESHRHLIECPEEWRGHYEAKGMKYVDPFLQAAVQTYEPTLFSKVKATTPGQVTLMEDARKFGLRSGIIFPSRIYRNMLMVLYLTSTREPEVMDDFLDKTRPLLRMVAHEVFEWWALQEKRHILAQLKLSDTDLELLRFVLKDLHTEEIAQLMGMTSSQVNNRFRWINREFETNSRKESALKALRLGLL